MRRLSSVATVWYKRVLPVLWFGFAVVFFALAWLHPSRSHGAPPALLPIVPLFMPLFMLAIGYALMRRLVFDLADEAWLDGDEVVVVKRGERTRIPLLQVINVNSTAMVNPPRVTLMLRQADPRLGESVSFVPAGPRGFLSGFRPDPVATALIRRIDDLRRRAA